MSTLKCLVIEDEKPASDLLRDYISSVPGLELVGVCEDVMTATDLLGRQPVDIIFLDINLPRVNGMDFIRTVNRNYSIIVTTAYQQYAVEGYELDVTDYLLKPVSFERFLRAVNKARGLAREAAPADADEQGQRYFFVKSDSRYEKVNTGEILYIEALQNYITIHCAGKKVITYSSLKNIESYLPSKEFLRVQKSFIVSVPKIDRIEGDDIVIGKTVIPISRALKEEVMSAILNNRLYRHKG